MLYCIMMTAAGFLSGSIMYSYLLPKLLRSVDVRECGEDGNPGSTNAIRTAGNRIGLLCMALDIFKAFLPVFLAVSILHIHDYRIVPVVLSPVVGHAFSPFLGFRGGKAVACLFGTLLGLIGISRIVFVLALVMAFFQFIIVLKPDALHVVASIVIACIIVYLFEMDLPPVRLSFLAANCIVLFKHSRALYHEDKSLLFGHYEVAYKDKKLTMRRV